MARAACTFRATDVTRAIKAVEAAGKKIRKVEVGKDGKVTIEIGEPDTASGRHGNEWDDVLDHGNH